MKLLTDSLKNHSRRELLRHVALFSTLLSPFLLFGCVHAARAEWKINARSSSLRESDVQRLQNILAAIGFRLLELDKLKDKALLRENYWLPPHGKVMAEVLQESAQTPLTLTVIEGHSEGFSNEGSEHVQVLDTKLREVFGTSVMRVK